MKKKRIQTFIALFWGFNFIFLIFYALFSSIVNLIKHKKEEIYEDEEYKRQFNILISIPIITLLFLIVNSFMVHISQIIVNYIILTIYQLGIVISVGFILYYPEEILKLFDKKASNIILTYKQFGFFILADIAFQIFAVSSWRLLYNSNAFFIFNLISLLALSLLIYRYYQVMKYERKDIDKLAKFEQLLNLKSDNFRKLEKNIIQILEYAEEMIKNENYDQYLMDAEKIDLKCQKLLKIAKKSKKRENISTATILDKKVKKQRYKVEKERDLKEIKKIQKKIQETKFDSSKEDMTLINELKKLLNTRLKSAKRIRNQKDIEKFTSMLKDLKK